MSETKPLALSGVAETLLLPLYNRAMESQRPDAMLEDEKAVELVTQMSLDFSRVRQIPISEASVTGSFVRVAAPASGQISDLLADVGTNVNKGDGLATIQVISTAPSAVSASKNSSTCN